MKSFLLAALLIAAPAPKPPSPPVDAQLFVVYHCGEAVLFIGRYQSREVIATMNDIQTDKNTRVFFSQVYEYTNHLAYVINVENLDGTECPVKA